MKGMVRLLAGVLVFTVLLGCLALAAPAEARYTETETSDGWILVENDGGVTLGYSPDSGVTLLEEDGYAFKDLNKNGALDIYEDWRLSPDERSASLAEGLDFRECLGLMMYSDIFTIESDGSVAYPNMKTSTVYDKLDQGVYSFLSFAMSNPAVTLAKWNNNGQAYAESLKYGIPMNVSSNPNSFGAPSGMAIGATFDTELVNAMYDAKAKMYRAEGVATELGPQIELATDPRWVRAGWTYTEDPALARDLANAAINGYQSTYDEDGNDLGWGPESVIAMMKHYPGDGSSEGGRYNGRGGQYQVYPGGGFMTSLIPFLDGGLNLTGKTGRVAALMTSYAISYSDDGAYGDLVHTAASDYKVRELTRETYGFDGLICTDWNVANDGYGTEDWTKAEVLCQEIMVGIDQLGGEVDPDAAVYTEVRQMLEDKLGVDGALARVRTAARHVLCSFFEVGLFDNPYVDTKQATKTVNDEDLLAIFDEAWHKSIVMLKNEGGVIHERTGDGEKPTVYIPMQYTPSTFGYMYSTTASWDLPVDLKTAERYFNVVTDTVGEPTGAPVSSDSAGSGEASGSEEAEAAAQTAGEPTYTENDIIRASDEEIAACDFCLIFVTASSTGTGWSDNADGGRDYVPISLQYRPYTADSDSVRRVSISGDILEDGTKENRSYYGKTADPNSYESHLDMILDTAERAGAVDLPVVVCVSATTAFCLGEFEPEAAAILIAFSDRPTESNTTSFLDIVAGAYEPQGLLPIQMPRDMEAVEAQLEDTPRDMDCYVDTEGNTYDFAYGLNWSGLINDARTETYRVPPLTEPAMAPVG